MNTGKLIIFTLAVLAALLPGCPEPVYEETHTYDVKPNVAPVTPDSNNPQSQPPTSQPADPKQPEWVNQTVKKEGNGAIDPTKYAQNPAQAKLLAKRAATIDAKRNLIEHVLGLRIDSRTVVRDFVTESDDINAQTSGFIRDVREVGKHFDSTEGIYTVTVELKLYTVWNVVRERRRVK